jgi:hypothetical protein
MTADPLEIYRFHELSTKRRGEGTIKARLAADPETLAQGAHAAALFARQHDKFLSLLRHGTDLQASLFPV